MARIPQFQRQIFASGVIAPTPGAIRLQNINIAQAGFQQLAKTSGVVANALFKQQEQQATAEATEFNSRISLQFQQQFDQSIRKPEVQQNPGLATKEVGNIASDIVSSDEFKEQSGFVQSLTRRNVNNLKLKFGGQALKYVNTQSFNNSITALNRTQSNIEIESLRSDASIEDLSRKFTATVAANTKSGLISLNQGEKIIMQGVSSIVRNKVQRLTDQKDFEGALDLVTGGQFDDFLPAEQQVKLQRNIRQSAERDERQAAQQLKVKQEKQSFEFFNQIINREAVTTDTVADAVRIGKIDASQGEKLQKLILNPTPAQDNIYTFTALNTKLAEGTLTEDDILEASSRGDLSHATTKSYLSSLTSRIATNPAVKNATKLVEAQYEKSFFGIRSLQDQEKLTSDIIELQQRALSGKENPMLIAQEIIKRNKEAEQLQIEDSRTRRQLKKRMGKVTTKNIQRLQQDIIGRLDGGTITRDDANQQLKVLRQLEEESPNE